MCLVLLSINRSTTTWAAGYISSFNQQDISYIQINIDNRRIVSHNDPSISYCHGINHCSNPGSLQMEPISCRLSASVERQWATRLPSHPIAQFAILYWVFGKYCVFCKYLWHLRNGFYISLYIWQHHKFAQDVILAMKWPFTVENRQSLLSVCQWTCLYNRPTRWQATQHKAFQRNSMKLNFPWT